MLHYARIESGVEYRRENAETSKARFLVHRHLTYLGTDTTVVMVVLVAMIVLQRTPS